jgi:hypothetical protein
LPPTTSTEGPDSPDLLATLTVADPDTLVGAVATFAARTNAALKSLEMTPQP